MEKYNYVLYIEDDEDDVLIFTESFKAVSDAPVISLQDSSRLFSFLQQDMAGHQPCLLIMDINLPKFSGIELLKQIREEAQYRHLPVVMFTTSLSMSDMETCKALDAQIIIKPNSFQEWQAVGQSLVQYCPAAGGALMMKPSGE